MKFAAEMQKLQAVTAAFEISLRFASLLVSPPLERPLVAAQSPASHFLSERGGRPAMAMACQRDVRGSTGALSCRYGSGQF